MMRTVKNVKISILATLMVMVMREDEDDATDKSSDTLILGTVVTGNYKQCEEAVIMRSSYHDRKHLQRSNNLADTHASP